MCTLCAPSAPAMEGFAGRMVEMLNHAAIVQMISIGHRTGLFDTLSAVGPATSQALADAAGLDERYVREWLGAMTTGRIVDHDPAAGVFWLPDDHAALLTRAAAPNNLAVTSQFLPVLAQVEDRVIGCFHAGGGVPYEAFPRFHEVMAEESDQTAVAALFDHIIPLVPGLDARLRGGIDVLDVGCGRGHALLAMAERYPLSDFTGYDLSDEAIAHATRVAKARGLRNLRFQRRDLSGFRPDRTFDLVTAFDAVHDQADPAGLLAGVRAAVRESGVFLMQDIAGDSTIAGNMAIPLAPFTYTISCMHCMTVSLAQGGAGLGAAWGEPLARRMLAEAGFRSIETHRLDHDIQNAYFVALP